MRKDTLEWNLIFTWLRSLDKVSGIILAKIKRVILQQHLLDEAQSFQIKFTEENKAKTNFTPAPQNK